MNRPTLRLNPGQGRRLRAGAPWVFSNEIAMKPEYRQMPPGGLVSLEGDDGARLGTFMFNPHSLIAARLLDRDPAANIDADWLRQRLREAIALRERVCDTAFHRLVHAEADGLPGLVIDRYDDVAVMQANTAGMDRLTPLIVEALTGLLPLRAVVARNDSAARRQEGLAEGVALLFGTDATVEVAEGGVRFPVDPLGGQKTGWYFDQRPNRDRVAALAKDARVLDVFCHVGAFGLRCALAGASDVTLVDSSASTLAQAEMAATLNGIADRCAYSARRCVRRDGGTRRRAVRHRGVRSTGVRPVAQGCGRWPARIRPDGTPGRASGRTGWVPVRRVVQLPRTGGGLECADRLWPASRAARGSHPVHRRRRSGPPGASAPAGVGVSEDAIDPGAIVAAFSE